MLTCDDPAIPARLPGAVEVDEALRAGEVLGLDDVREIDPDWDYDDLLWAGLSVDGALTTGTSRGEPLRIDFSWQRVETF